MRRALAGSCAGIAAILAVTPTLPRSTDISYYCDLFDHSVSRPIRRAFDPALLVRRVSGHPREAPNVDEHDQVRLPSTWWQPRLGYRAVDVDEMLRGPGPGLGPAPGRWQVTRAKTQGITPGFFIKDGAGDGFILKFDPPDVPELATGAEAVATILFWAAGYNTPDNTVVTFRAEDLDVAPGATDTDDRGRKHEMTRAYLEPLLARVKPQADGRYRALASRLIAGKPLGPFEYHGRRRDDPEDMIPHEQRRELRGLWIIAAWTNHADVRGPNSLDMWVTEGGRSFVRHQLIDFGSTLGSAAVKPRLDPTCSEYFLDYGVMARSLVTLGLRPFPRDRVAELEFPSIGGIDADHFDPEGWRPDYPNPAFDERTGRDVRWGARIVAAFTDEQIRAAVGRGRYSDPRAAEYLARVLIERRDKIAHRWLDQSRSNGRLSSAP